MNHIQRHPVAARVEPAGYVRIESGRVDWVDYLKGLCILLVVMMHAVLGVEKAAGGEGWMHVVVATAQPMRMPAFFLAAGLFLMRGIDAPAGRFFDRKILHFAYFYGLWLTIQFAFKAPAMVAEGGVFSALATYFVSYVQPFGTLWFIYILPVFYCVARLTRAVSPPIMLAAAALLQVLPIHTGAVVVDEFASYFVWFYLGYAYAPRVFRLAERAARHPWTALAVVAAIVALTWRLTGIDVSLPALFLPGAAETVVFSALPVVSLVLGLLGSAALVAFSAVLAERGWLDPVRWCGAHSIVIYLAFFLPMAVTRAALLKLGIVDDIGTQSLLVWAAAVLGPVILFMLVEKTGIGRFLFERPAWARLQRD